MSFGIDDGSSWTFTAGDSSIGDDGTFSLQLLDSGDDAGSLDGTFYGTSAVGAGGTFFVDIDTDTSASGVFRAMKTDEEIANIFSLDVISSVIL